MENNSEIVVLWLCRHVAGRGAVQEKHRFHPVSGFAGRRNFPFSRAVSEPNRVTKWHFIILRRLWWFPPQRYDFSDVSLFLIEQSFIRFICQVLGKKIFKKGEGTIVGRKTRVDASACRIET